MNHILSAEQFTKKDIENIFDLANDMQQNPKKYSNSLNGKIIATLFYEPSTRTRLSFESAILRLGAANISTENAKEMSSTIKGESLTDTIQVIHGYADAIVMRHFEDDSGVRAAEVSNVPIINAGAGSGEHPTQALLDAFTIYQLKNGIDGVSVAILGDLLYGRTIHSLIKLLGLYQNITIYALSIPSLALPKEYTDFMLKKGIKYVEAASFLDLPQNLDIIYQTRTQTERFLKAGIPAAEFIINKDIMDKFSSQTFLMHPLPRNQEIANELDQDPRSVYFNQSLNGMYVRMALLYTLLT